MADNALDQIVDDLRNSGDRYFPGHSEIKAVRVVGHTPKPDHYIYEIVLDFPDRSERVNAKIYRGKQGARGPQELAKQETQNLHFVHQAFEQRKLDSVPRPMGDFADLGAVVSTKVNGIPLQSIIMKAALLPDNGNRGLLEASAKLAGEWLQQFHKATAGMPCAVDGEALMDEMEKLCAKARKDGLPEESTEVILNNTRSTLSRQKKPVRTSAVLQEFIPLNALVTEGGVGFCEFASLSPNCYSLYDAAVFLAAVEALEKYPFCNRSITTRVQDAFLDAYGVSAQEQPLLNALKMKVLLRMFAQGRVIKDSAARKKVMWANVMKRFLQQAAERTMAPAA